MVIGKLTSLLNGGAKPAGTETADLAKLLEGAKSAAKPGAAGADGKKEATEEALKKLSKAEKPEATEEEKPADAEASEDADKKEGEEAGEAPKKKGVLKWIIGGLVAVVAVVIGYKLFFGKKAVSPGA